MVDRLSGQQIRLLILAVLVLPWLLWCLFIAWIVPAESSPDPTPAGGVVWTMTPARSGLVWTMTPDPRGTPRASKAGQPDGAGQLVVSPWLLPLCGGPVALGSLVIGVRQGWVSQLLALILAYFDRTERLRRGERRERARIVKQERRILSALAREIARSCCEVLTGVGFAYQYRNPGQRRKRFQTVQFSHAVIVGQEQLILRVGLIPMGKSRFSLFADAPGERGKPITNGKTVVSWYAYELYLALGRQVEFAFYEDIGILFMISLKQGISGVPRLVLWRDPDQERFSMMDGDPFDNGAGQMPPIRTSPETRLYIPVGLGRNRKVIRKDLKRLPHLIVSGTTGSGKSVFLNAMICTWLERNTPATLQLYLIDLKRVEFAPYLQLSLDDSQYELKRPSMVVNVVQDEDESVEVLEALNQEIVARQRLLDGVAIDIRGYNQQAYNDPNRRTLPYIVVVFDEVSMVMLNRRTKQAATRFIERTLAVGRAFGVHMVLCTQTIQSKIIGMLVTSNTPGKMIFRQATRTASINALGDQRGWRDLEQPGMGYFTDERGATDLVQAPLIQTSQRDQVIQAELDRMLDREQEPENLEDYSEILDWCLENLAGAMTQKPVEQQFRDRGMGMGAIRNWIKTQDNTAWVVGGAIYAQRPPPRDARYKGRWLILANLIFYPCEDIDQGDPGYWPIRVRENGADPGPGSSVVDEGGTDPDFDYQEYLKMTGDL